MKLRLLSLFCVVTLFSPAQELDSSSFDFWVGSWDLQWVNAQGDTLTGSNRIEKILEGNVIQENFTDSASGFFGKSWSHYKPGSKTWTQLWVDNKGGYLEFTGAKINDSLAFVMKPAMISGEMRVRRMVFHKITPQGFVWDWQLAKVGSNQWMNMWRIHYSKKKE